jgi:hypothetical protein
MRTPFDPSWWSTPHLEAMKAQLVQRVSATDNRHQQRRHQRRIEKIDAELERRRMRAAMKS